MGTPAHDGSWNTGLGWLRRPNLVASFCALAGVAAVCPAGAYERLLRPASPASLFFIAKSENRNQVHYGIHLGTNCSPLGAKPVYGYWRMVERGGAVEPLLSVEQGAYGVEDEQKVETTADGFRVRVRMRGLPSRPVDVSIIKAGDRCIARPEAIIAGAPAQLSSIYLKLRWPFGVDHLLVQGARLSDGQWLEETVRDGE